MLDSILNYICQLQFPILADRRYSENSSVRTGLQSPISGILIPKIPGAGIFKRRTQCKYAAVSRSRDNWWLVLPTFPRFIRERRNVRDILQSIYQWMRQSKYLWVRLATLHHELAEPAPLPVLLFLFLFAYLGDVFSFLDICSTTLLGSFTNVHVYK